MENNNDKIWNIANDDLTFISLFLEKIKVLAISTHCYVDHLLCKPNEQINNVMCMLETMEDIINVADKNLTEIINKLCAIYRETKETEAAK